MIARTPTPVAGKTHSKSSSFPRRNGNQRELKETLDQQMGFNSLRPNNDASQTSHCNIRGLSVSEVMRIENMITQVQLY